MDSSRYFNVLNSKHTIWIGNLAETMGEFDRAFSAFESALRNNPYSIPALTQLASLSRARDAFPKVYSLHVSL